VRTERTLLDKVEEDLKRARLPPLDWYHVLYEIDRSPKGMMRQTGVQDRTQMAQYNVCRLVDRLEREGDDFHSGVRAAYRDLAADRDWCIIDGSGPPDAVAALVEAAVTERLNP